MLSVKELDELLVESDPTNDFQSTLDKLEPADVENFKYLVHLIAQCGETSFAAGYSKGSKDFQEFLHQKYRLEEKVNGVP